MNAEPPSVNTAAVVDPAFVLFYCEQDFELFSPWACGDKNIIWREYLEYENLIERVKK